MAISRIILNLIIIGSAFLLPWWCPFLLSLVALWYFNYIEIILIGALLDTLYATSFHSWQHILFTLVGFLLFVLAEHIKPKLSFYSKYV
jgi:hypothetical protein